MGIDTDNFEPEFKVIPNKKKIIKELKSKAKEHDNIYLAADPDREGESICWHLKNELKDSKSIYRITFNEITKDAILEAFKEPHDIDMDKVNAQQARRMLDRLVGYSLSPLLWKKVTRGLSAGRVQSVAVRLIVERENQINDFKPSEYWEVEIELGKEEDESKKFKAKLFKIDGKKYEINNKQKADEVKKDLEASSFIIDKIQRLQRRRHPKPPFITSTLQQAAYNNFKFTARRTMRIAQQLYEGVELKEGETTGLITYMRTDSVRVANQAIDKVRGLIKTRYGDKYIPKDPNRYKSKKSAQEAHEAIRPAYVSKDPDAIKDSLTEDQYKLYTLIWNRFVSSQMKPAIFDNTQIFITAGKYLLKAIASVLKFDGYLKVYKDESFDEVLLPDLEEKEQLKLYEILPTQHFTKPPARYSEASLIKALEEKGIGRPSTYAPTIYTIIIRDYVRRIKGYLFPTELGTIVNELLVEHFPDILNMEFTADLENKLDLIEEGKKNRVEVLKEFYKPFIKDLEQAKTKIENINKKVVTTAYKCKECGATMIIKWGRWGKFLSCSKFPDCRYSEAMTTEVECPKEGCDGKLIQRRSKKIGKIFYGCSNFPKCDHISNKLPEDADDK